METNADGFATLDLSRFESGMYVVSVETEKGVIVQKVNLLK